MLIISFSVYIFFGSIYLLFSGKSGVWSNDTVLLDLPMESASCLKFSISNLIYFFNFCVIDTVSYSTNLTY